MDLLVGSALLVHAEQLVLVGLVAAVVVAVAQVGGLDADVGGGALDAHAATVDGQTGAGLGALVRHRLVVAVVVSVAHLALRDAVPVGAGERAVGADRDRRAVQLVAAVAAVVDGVALLLVGDAAPVRAQEVLLGAEARD